MASSREWPAPPAKPHATSPFPPSSPSSLREARQLECATQLDCVLRQAFR